MHPRGLQRTGGIRKPMGVVESSCDNALAGTIQGSTTPSRSSHAAPGEPSSTSRSTPPNGSPGSTSNASTSAAETFRRPRWRPPTPRRLAAISCTADASTHDQAHGAPAHKSRRINAPSATRASPCPSRPQPRRVNDRGWLRSGRWVGPAACRRSAGRRSARPRGRPTALASGPGAARRAPARRRPRWRPRRCRRPHWCPR